MANPSYVPGPSIVHPMSYDPIHTPQWWTYLCQSSSTQNHPAFVIGNCFYHCPIYSNFSWLSSPKEVRLSILLYSLSVLNVNLPNQMPWQYTGFLMLSRKGIEFFKNSPHLATINWSYDSYPSMQAVPKTNPTTLERGRVSQFTKCYIWYHHDLQLL